MSSVRGVVDGHALLLTDNSLGSNLLVANNHLLKLTDFGLARELLSKQKAKSGRRPRFTNKVITLWQRPPELLLGETTYDFSVDIWSTGCVLLEVLTGSAPFQGRNELDQAKKIFQVCGWPEEDSWPELANLPLFVRTASWRKRFAAASLAAFLLEREVDPSWKSFVTR